MLTSMVLLFSSLVVAVSLMVASNNGLEAAAQFPVSSESIGLIRSFNHSRPTCEYTVSATAGISRKQCSLIVFVLCFI